MSKVLGIVAINNESGFTLYFFRLLFIFFLSLFICLALSSHSHLMSLDTYRLFQFSATLGTINKFWTSIMSWVEYFDKVRHEKYRPASIGEVSKCKNCDKDYPSSENAEKTYEETKPRCGRKNCPVKPDGSGNCIVAENLKANTYMRSCNLQYLMKYCPDCQHASLIPCKAFNCENTRFKLLSRLSGPAAETCPICVEYQPVKGYFDYYNEFCVRCSGNRYEGKIVIFI